MKNIFLIFFLIGCQKSAPNSIGIVDNKLTACSEAKNCLVSFDYNDGTYLAPIESNEEPARIYTKILSIVEKNSNAKIIEKRDDYIYAEMNSGLLSGVVDLEFWFGEPSKVHFKSASRSSFSDLGASRDTIESIKFKFHQNDF